MAKPKKQASQIGGHDYRLQINPRGFFCVHCGARMNEAKAICKESDDTHKAQSSTK